MAHFGNSELQGNPRSQPPVRWWSWCPSPALKLEAECWVWWKFHQISPANELHLQGTARLKSLSNPNWGVTSPKATECEPFNLSACRKGTEMQFCTHRKSSSNRVPQKWVLEREISVLCRERKSLIARKFSSGTGSSMLCRWQAEYSYWDCKVFSAGSVVLLKSPRAQSTGNPQLCTSLVLL